MTASDPMMGVPTVSAAAALTSSAEGAFLVDCREQNEWDAGHADNAIHLALSSLLAMPLPDFSGAQVLVICRSGVRSKQAAAYLINQGFEAVSVDGGMREWQSLGGSVVAADGSVGEVI